MIGKPSVMIIFFLAMTFAVPATGWSREALPSLDSGSVPPEGTIHIMDAVVCQDVVDRQPIGTGEVIPKDSAKIYCFTRVVGALKDTMVIHNWYYQGVLKSSVQLTVGSPNWRTWSTKALDPGMVGQWMVEVLSENGSPLGSLIFFVQ
jgi:hypothetical protein